MTTQFMISDQPVTICPPKQEQQPMIVHRDFKIIATMEWWTLPAIEGIMLALVLTVVLLWARMRTWKRRATDDVKVLTK